MRKIKIACGFYKAIQRDLKNYLATEPSRPILEYIHIVVKDNKITFEALDGFMAIKKEQPATEPSEDFETFLPVINVPDSLGEMTIEKTDAGTIVEWQYCGVTTTLKFKEQEKKWPVKLNDLIKPQDDSYKISVDPGRLMKALKSYKRECVLYIPKDEQKAIYIRSFKPIDKESIILPIRNTEDNK